MQAIARVQKVIFGQETQKNGFLNPPKMMQSFFS
jgi:hypothetical protein